MPWRIVRGDELRMYAALTDVYLAEIIIHTKSLRFAALPSFGREIDPALSLVVWTLKREVRATGGCLGMYRR